VNDRYNKTYWATDDSITSASIVINFKEPAEIDHFIVQEYIRLGQRIEAFSVEAFVNNQWTEVASGTTIGYQRILKFPVVNTTNIRFTILKSKACPVISNIELY
jgi:alpha-L-fucosidase